jgi:hypothetical protein
MELTGLVKKFSFFMGCKVWISNTGRSKRFCVFLNGADRLWGPHRLLFNGYQGSFPGGKTAGT